MSKPQNKMKAKLETAGIPFKEVEVYGNQIVVTAWSKDAADKWQVLLAKFAKIRGAIQSMDYAQDQTCRKGRLETRMVDVFRVYAAI